MMVALSLLTQWGVELLNLKRRNYRRKFWELSKKISESDWYGYWDKVKSGKYNANKMAIRIEETRNIILKFLQVIFNLKIKNI